MKKFSIIVAIFFAMFMFVNSAKADFVDLRDWVGGNHSTAFDSRIVNPNQPWGAGITYPQTDYWWISPEPWRYTGGVSGSYMTIDADYYVGFSFSTANSAFLQNHLPGTLKAENVRCSLNNDRRIPNNSSHAPIVTDFSTEYLTGYSDSSESYYHVTIRIKFKYYQEINSINYEGNYSCWFERNPSDGLFAQSIYNNNGSNAIEYYGYVNKLDLVLSKDPNTEILNSVNNKLDGVNDKLNGVNDRLNDTNNKLNDVNNSLNNDDVDTAGANNFFSGFSDTDHGGISAVVTAPLKLLQSMTNTCEPLYMDVLGADVELPCGDTLFWGREDVKTFRNTWNILVGGVLIYSLMLKLFQVIQNLKDPESDKVEVMKL